MNPAIELILVLEDAQMNYDSNHRWQLQAARMAANAQRLPRLKRFSDAQLQMRLAKLTAFTAEQTAERGLILFEIDFRAHITPRYKKGSIQ